MCVSFKRRPFNRLQIESDKKDISFQKNGYKMIFNSEYQSKSKELLDRSIS